ncbi:unnamed protein product, partial [marine sediment metagenome]
MREYKLGRLLRAVYKPESAPPGFKKRLLKRLLEKDINVLMLKPSIS